ncbi:MAG: T9SS type A sorting domain-containing protein, partial [Ignavibacteria bacterium]|nr:T9SS type A sorting domain-containing protein [Ignavibacteria bacterium]
DTSGIFYLGSSEGVLKSTDYGNTWLRFNAGIENRSITGIAVATDGKVYCSAKFAGIYFSSDGCISWNNLSVSRQKATIIGFSVNAAGEIFAADQAGMLYKSTNTGCNWTIADKGITNQSTSEINRIIWQQDGKGLLVKEKSLFRTLNNGKDWVEIPLPEGMSYAFLCPGPGNSMYASAEGNLYQSTDFGTYWSQIKAPDYSDDNGFRIYSGQSGILLSINKNADIKRTEAGGMNWMSTFINGNVSGFDWGAGVVKESGTILFVVMHKGGILRSVNNGISWELVNNGIPSQYFYDLVVTKSGILYVATGSGVYRSTNNGDDWNAVNTGLPLGVVRSIIVGNDGYLFCGVDGQGIYKSAEPLRVENEMAVTKEKFTLEQNYPNPFNPATTITYNVPVSGSVTLVIFDVTGKEIARLVDGYKKAGSYSVQFSASNLVSGVYFYQLKANGCVETKKMTLIK